MYRKTSFLVMVFALMVGLSTLVALAAPPIQEGGQAYTVQKDDNLWKIAEKYWGNGAAYPTIVDATNRKAAEDDTFATIVNPRLIYPGWKLWIPRDTGITVMVAPPKVVTYEFREGVTGPVSFDPITVTNRQPLQLNVVGTNQITRTHFSLKIGKDSYPSSDTFTLTVTAIPRATIAANFFAECQEDEDEEEEQEKCEYPEVVGLTDDGRLIIYVDSGEYAGREYVAANPYAFSVTGIVTFTNPVTVSISVDIPTDEITKPHGIIIHHEDDGTTERFPATQWITQNAESGFYLVTNSDSITRCCAANAHCSSGPTCLKCE